MPVIFLSQRTPWRPITIETDTLPFGPFMVEHQYKVLFISLLVGSVWVGIYRLLVASWFLARLSLLMAIVSFVPTGLVALVHLREVGPFLWWDKSNVVLTTRRPTRLEKIELVVMASLWAVIFGFVILTIFVLSR